MFSHSWGRTNAALVNICLTFISALPHCSPLLHTHRESSAPRPPSPLETHNASISQTSLRFRTQQPNRDLRETSLGMHALPACRHSGSAEVWIPVLTVTGSLGQDCPPAPEVCEPPASLLIRRSEDGEEMISVSPATLKSRFQL